MKLDCDNKLQDDGLVLMQGELCKPELIQKIMAKKFLHNDGKTAPSVIKRYYKCFPYPDNTTPTFSEFKALTRS